MINIVTFSGGKDSEALLAWAEDSLDSYIVVTCDTKWEHPITYAHIQDICSRLTRASSVHLLSPPKYPQGMPQLCGLSGACLR
ncbi:MAG: hypothetical protein DMG96_31750 [Acidobacteria bacterium]|nr:MAG: hypothetical protein DMG98_09205 [Acidobacteriota bacterium]PYV70271.1 MAG: hypothetical protein DMG96_31750 [Acidobacteriota bacterium]